MSGTKKVYKECEVNVALMAVMNQVQGSIFAHEILSITEEQVKEALAKSNVTEVDRVRTMRSGVATPNGLHVLTFSKRPLPEYVTIGYMRYEVRKYYPRPFRCNMCLQFGHSKKRCPTGIELCRNCGDERHSEKCQNAPRCVNCTGPNNNHGSLAKDCPETEKEIAITRIRIDEDISYNLSRRKNSRRLWPDVR
jgi:hypothetical protein